MVGPAWIEACHDLLAPAHGPDWQPPADDLAECCQIRLDAKVALRAIMADSERDYFVENQHDAVSLGDFAQERQEPWLGCDHAARAHHRLDDHCRQLMPMRADDLLGCPRVVERSEEHTSELQSRGHLVCRLLLEK